MNRDLGLRPSERRSAVEPSYAEKRRHPRQQLAVRCWIADGRYTLYARVHDVSLGGLSLRAPAPFAPEVEVDLALVLPPIELDEHGGEISIRARGRVVWVYTPIPDDRRAGTVSRARMGARFVDVLDEVLLQRFLGRP